MRTAQTPTCAKTPAVAWPSGGECVFGSCEGRRECTAEGYCTLQDGKCVVGSDADCERSTNCKERGECFLATWGRCRADCRVSDDCKDRGECTRKKDTCIATSDADCAASKLCDRGAGYCKVMEERCGPESDEACRRTEGCKEWGMCSKSDRVCAALTKQDCARSRRCKEDGDCTPHREGRCVPGSETDCRNSAKCKEEALCGYAEGKCIAVSDAECRRSPDCKVSGRCVVRNHQCESSGDEDCKRSSNCKDRGECLYSFGGCGKTHESLRPRM